MRRAFKDLKASKDPQVTTFCLSNSNEIYIKTILEVSALVRDPFSPMSFCGITMSDIAMWAHHTQSTTT